MWIVYLRRTLYSPSACCRLPSPCNDSLPPPSACRHFGSRAFNQAQTFCERGLQKGRGLGGRVLIPLHATFPTAFFAASFAQCQGTHTNTHTRCTVATHLLLLLLLLRVLAKCKLRWRRRPPVVAIIAPRQFQMKAGVSNVNFCQPTPCAGFAGGACCLSKHTAP